MAVSVTREIVDEAVSEETLPEGKTPDHTEQQDNVELPYTDIKAQTGTPYTVEYFELGETWDDPDGGFEDEVNTIEEYFQNEIERGELANTKQAVQKRLKEVEKINNLRGEDRTIIKIGIIAEYLKFMRRKTELTYTYKKYGTKR